jgi:hypothetical protein
MADRRRGNMAEALAQQLDGEIVWDRRRDIWDTAKRAMRAHSGDWHLVIQDDAVVSRRLVPAINAMLGHIPPNALLSLYFPAHKHAEMPDFAPTGTWTYAPRLIGGVAVVYPVKVIETVIERAESEQVRSYDSRIFWPTYYPQPSLVDHGSARSLRGGRKGRRALEFIGRNRSGLEIDWSN